MQGNTVEGLVWADYKRPAKLKLRLNNFNETFPDQWKEVLSFRKSTPPHNRQLDVLISNKKH